MLRESRLENLKSSHCPSQPKISLSSLKPTTVVLGLNNVYFLTKINGYIL